MSRGIPEPPLNEEEAFVGDNLAMARRYDAMLERQLGGNIVAELSRKCDVLAVENRALRHQVALLKALLKANRFLSWLARLFKGKEAT